MSSDSRSVPLYKRFWTRCSTSVSPQTPEEKVQLMINAELAAFPYHRSLEKIWKIAGGCPEAQWQPACSLALAVGASLDLPVQSEHGFIYDKETGLTAYVLENPSMHEARLIFGGTASGETARDSNIRTLANSSFALKQWIANAQNTLRFDRPASYLQARALTAELVFFMAFINQYSTFSLTLSGHSKGGGEATYSALTQNQPSNAICYASVELGEKLLTDIPPEHSSKAGDFIIHYLIEGDLIPRVGTLLPGLKLLGRVVTLPAQRLWDSPLDRHIQFVRHIHHYVNSNK